jgi:NADH-quinone oxidoreductase subunit E
MSGAASHFTRTDIRERRRSLLPLLKKIHDAERYLSQESIESLSRKLRMSENEIYGVATFYPQFRFAPPGKYHIQVCLGNACHVGGAQNFMEAMKLERNLLHGQTSPNGMLSLEGIGCLGCCAMSPVVVVNNEIHGRMNRVTFMQLVESLDPSEEKQ